MEAIDVRAPIVECARSHSPGDPRADTLWRQGN